MKAKIDLTKEYGLILDGGGARGAYQIGAWKALVEAGVKVNDSSRNLGWRIKWSIDLHGRCKAGGKNLE